MFKLSLLLIQIVLVVFIIYSFFFGPLLFLNPIKLGMRVRHAERATVYTRNLYKLNPLYELVDSYMAEAESFYNLKYKNKVSIYVAESQSEFNRYMPPWVDGSNVGGLTLQFGNVIYINPTRIKSQKYSEEEFLKHELVHNLISQNTLLVNNMIIDNQQWFSEGLATYFGGPLYYNENEFKLAMKDRKLDYDEKSNKLFVNLDPNDPKFNYTLYSYFIKFLKEEYGLEKFNLFLLRYLESPSNYKVGFFEIYRKRFSQVVDEFLREY